MFEENTAKLVAWLEKHNTNGAYIGSAHHPIWGVINETKLPHTFHYYGIILGYLNLYERLGDEKYLQKAKGAGYFLCGLQKSSGQYQYDTFEVNTGKNIGTTLIHNVLPSISLIRLARETADKKYLEVAKKNIVWSFSKTWNGEFLSGCINQDMCAAEALATLYLMEKKDLYIKRAEMVADWCLKYQIDESELKGGFIRGKGQENIVVPWYDGKTAFSYYNLYKITGQECYLESAKETANFLIKNMKESGLVHWYLKKRGRWAKRESPFLISPIGLVLYLLDDLGIRFNAKIIDAQLPNGGFPSAYGFNDLRDYEPVLGWNQFMFLYLSSLVRKELPIVSVDEKQNSGDVNFPVIVRGHVRGIGNMNGYVDLIKEHLVEFNSKLVDGYFEVKGKKDDYTLRIRADSAKWKTTRIKKDDNYVQIFVFNHKFFWPYYFFESVLTKILIAFFSSNIIYHTIPKLRKLKELAKRLLK